MRYNAPYQSTDQNAAYVDRSVVGAVRGSIPPAAAIEHDQREIVNCIVQSGQTPSAADLTQLWKAFNLLLDGKLSGYVQKTVAQIASAGKLKLTNLDADSYYIIYLTSDVAASYSIFGSTDNGATERSDYKLAIGTTTYTNAAAQSFDFAGDMDVFCVYTGLSSQPAIFFNEVAALFSHIAARRLLNTPVGPVNAVTIQTTVAFYAVVQKVL